jgi:hypothetical protein
MMQAQVLYQRHPGVVGRSYTLTDVAHAVRACSRGNLGDTQWLEIYLKLNDLEGRRDNYSVGIIFEALSLIMAEEWLTFHERALLNELDCSQRAGGIQWELVPVSSRQLYWRVAADEQALAAAQADTVILAPLPT